MAYSKGTNFFVEDFDTNVDVAFVDSAGLSYFAKGTGTPPTTANLYAVGGIYIQTDGTTNVTYSNTGTSAAPVWVASGSSTGVQYTSRAITSAEILNLFGTPVTIVAAPGAANTLVVDGAVLEVRTTATAYTNGGGVAFKYSVSGGNATAGTIPVAIIQAGAGSSTNVLGPMVTGTGNTATKNNGIVLQNGSEAFLSGTGTATAHIWYRNVKVA